MTTTPNLELTGHNFIAGAWIPGQAPAIEAVNPRDGSAISQHTAATTQQAKDAIDAAAAAQSSYSRLAPDRIAAFLEAIADAIEGLGDTLLDVADRETALGHPRLTGERGRTCGQLRMFAQTARDQRWVQASIDTALPDRQPLPKPDLRKMRRPLGPVAVFGASNFPFAFGAAGGDTAAALAAGNVVVAKGHPSHPGTNELIAQAIRQAIDETGDVPPAAYSLLQGGQPELSQVLVEHPAIQAVGFTGSLRVGRILQDLAAKRDQPIPVFAEMGSVNPLFVLPGAMDERGPAIAEGLAKSVLMGVGQFCTSPGVAVVLDSPAVAGFTENLARHLAEAEAGTMLNGGIRRELTEAVQQLTSESYVERLAGSEPENDSAPYTYPGSLLKISGEAFLSQPELREELFGPVAIVVVCRSAEQIKDVAQSIAGNLTATLHLGSESHDEPLAADLIELLEPRTGRIIFNGFPTGVEVCPSMHHGGPYPASSSPVATSVGQDAIERFSRVVCYQNTPDALLPPALRNDNHGQLWRRLNGQMTTECVSRA